MKPWTAIAKNNETGNRTTLIFEGDYDGREAARDFRKKFNSMSLVALIPGIHREVYIENATTTIKKMATKNQPPKDKLFSGF
jgi:hypothetical protein